MKSRPAHLALSALFFAALTACGAQSPDTPPTGSGAVDRIIAKEIDNARKPNATRGIAIHRIGFKEIFAGTAIQYGATFKDENLIDLELSAHRLEGQQMLKSGTRMQNLPMTLGDVDIDASKGDGAPGMVLTGVPGYEDVSMRMNQGTLSIVALPLERDSFTGLPVIEGFEVNFKGRFLAFSEDDSKIVVDPVENRSVTISGSVRYHKD